MLEPKCQEKVLSSFCKIIFSTLGTSSKEQSNIVFLQIRKLLLDFKKDIKRSMYEVVTFRLYGIKKKPAL
jgi:hypothetical protein